jgi:hypothetical protein
VFRELMRLRDKVYAHTDEKADRSAGPITLAERGEIVRLNPQQGWQPFPRGLLPDVIALAERLRDEMRVSGEKIQALLNGDIEATGI